MTIVAVVSYMGYHRMVNCHKYLEKACLSLPIFHHGNNTSMAKKLLKYRNSLSSRLSSRLLRNYSLYPQLSNDSLGSRLRENQFNSVKYRFSHATPPDEKPVITLFTKVHFHSQCDRYYKCIMFIHMRLCCY